VCEKLHFMSTLTFVERGPQALVGTAFDRSHVDAGCSFCGACVDHCPTGTLAEKTRKWEGVAENTVKSVCPYCSAGCSIDLQVKKDTVIGAEPSVDASINGGNLCVHGRFGIPEMVNHNSRLLKPWKLVDGHRFEFAWDEAVELAAEKLSFSGKNSAVQVSSSLPLEDLFVARKFAENVLHLSSYSETSEKNAYSQLLAHETTFDALRGADCVLLAGLDTRYTLSWLEFELKTLRRNGAQVISVNAQERPLEQFADTFIHSNGDPADIICQLTSALKTRESGVGQLHQAVETLLDSRQRVLVIGDAYLADPAAAVALSGLADELNAGVICLPLQGNVFGALAAGTAPYYGSPNNPDVVYAIGCQHVAPAGFVIHQSSFKPTGAAELALPSSSFTERDGSFVNAEFRQRMFHKAVKPAGLALPDWQIMAAIARKMGAAGFDYESVEDIRKEMASAFPAGFWKGNITAGHWFASIGVSNDPVYLGSHLSSKVAGLAALLTTKHVKAGD
jgi:predicted molibdopterin-dependent oxidoreductase YjgC